MTRKEIDEVVKEIREHCRNKNCRNCEAQTVLGMVSGCGVVSNAPALCGCVWDLQVVEVDT